MERLWSPWRMEYILGAREGAGECLFCELLPKDDTEAMILKRGEHAFVVMNLYPYNPGHLMVAPARHVGRLDDLSRDELLSMGLLMQDGARAVEEEMNPDGFNLGMNVGRVAGAGVLGHLHWHVVPRWNGDSNFMSVTGATRTLPELVEDTYKKLKPRFE
ncbi:MAG: HIT domain-containing protein [Actinomycetota bacterium]